ncbi:hypothetical protein [Microtetraspora sp. NBRC 16547]|uniref:hypothetical protein n=1 Tax=Microtetraspora sp. NBRC 16547 TaxID=3030993 RepID=UPI0024A3D943|nr:hypothetical protein [Microtetraspora sp. NBRC 16547]GLW98871.1 hypothetical protein Misp02_29580 [Microtetraspora sp. NBRC 16547]
MNPTYNVKFWEIRANKTHQGPGKPKRVVAHTVRWTVDTREKSSTFRTKGLAETVGLEDQLGGCPLLLFWVSGCRSVMLRP